MWHASIIPVMVLLPKKQRYNAIYWRVSERGPVAQWIEQFRPKEKVAGSTLARITTIFIILYKDNYER